MFQEGTIISFERDMFIFKWYVVQNSTLFKGIVNGYEVLGDIKNDQVV